MRKLVLLAVVGLLAQLVDGSLGMGYGVTSATLLLAGGLGPAAASAAVHLAEIGTSLASGAAHHALGNTDWRTVGILAVPGFLGAFLGATLLASLDAEAARPAVAVLLLGLGAFVTWRFLSMGPRRLRFRHRPSARFLVPTGPQPPPPTASSAPPTRPTGARKAADGRPLNCSRWGPRNRHVT